MSIVSQPKAPRRLLAKSCLDPHNPPNEARYTGHTVAVVNAAQTLLRLRGTQSLAAVGLPETCLDRLSRIVILASLIHDLGKASAHFQAMLRGKQRSQLVRHEATSAWLAWQEPLRQWLEAALLDAADLPLVIAAAAGHHRKFTSKAVNPDDGLGDTMRVFTGHEDVAAVLAFGAKVLELAAAPELPDMQLTISGDLPDMVLFKDLACATRGRLKQEADAHALLAIAKALVVNADVAGSALPRKGARDDWMDSQLAERASRASLEALVSRRLSGRPERPFQSAVAASRAPITLVEAGCGNGKTLAAYAWFARQHVGRQLWVTYPTTGTALEGFRGYLLGFDDIASDLESMRRTIDLELCGVDEATGDDDGAEVFRDAHRCDSLRAWGRDVIACTVDTVLGLVQNHRKGLYAWAGLSQSAVVFDEIHAYDDRLFGYLLQFLERLPGIPVLLMTASLPTSRREALRELSRSRRGCELPIIGGDPGLESLERYVLSDGDPVTLTKEALDRGEKVLWVCNTVARCLETADAAISRGLAPLIYHSRFRYIDRVARHNDVISGFAGSDPCLAITTQVAEMSLDLSADLLVSELAPISALIQRMGRLNRRSSPERPGAPKPAIIIPVPSAAPYKDADLTPTAGWLNQLRGRAVSQKDLVDAWSGRDDPVRHLSSAWFEGGLITEPGELRETTPGLSVLLESDACSVRADRTQVTAYAIPMPAPDRRKSWRTWEQVAYLPVAPKDTIQYDPMRGGQWLV